MRSNWIASIALGVLVSLFAAMPSSQAADGELRKLIDELNKELTRGEKQGLVDPFFLRGLRNTISKYGNPWQKQLLLDKFSDRGPKPSPPWQVTAGEVLIDWRHGMRTVIEAKAPQQQSQQQTQQGGGSNDQTAALIGALLQQALGGGQGSSSTQQATQQQAQQPADPGFAAVIAPIRITNAFVLKADMSTRALSNANAPQRLELGPYQGANAGYRLAFSPNAKPYFELLRLSSRGSSSLGRYDKAINLSDNKIHSLVWTRTPGGDMRVILDGKTLMSVNDRSFKDPFDGFAIVNAGGDYAFRQIQIDGTN